MLNLAIFVQHYDKVIFQALLYYIIMLSYKLVFFIHACGSVRVMLFKCVLHIYILSRSGVHYTMLCLTLRT